jgi:hypothetical protein
LDKLKRVNSFYDAKITFFKDDAIKYGMIYSEMCPYRLPIIETKGSVESDIFFVGRDKGRLDFLIKIYENLSSKGFICDFNIMGVKEEDMKYQEIIQYNKWIPYDEVLRHVKASKCVLEVLQDMDNYVSIKTYEALQYHKKLITTNNSVVGRSFYNPNTIKVVNDPNDDISVFLHNAVDDADFQNGDDYTSFKRFEAEIESMLS